VYKQSPILKRLELQEFWIESTVVAKSLDQTTHFTKILFFSFCCKQWFRFLS